MQEQKPTGGPSLESVDRKIDGVMAFLERHLAGDANEVGKFKPGILPRISTLEGRVDKLESHRSWFWDKGVGIIAGLVGAASGMWAIAHPGK